MGDFSDFKQYHQTGISNMNQDHGLLSFHSKGVDLISSKTLKHCNPKLAFLHYFI